MKIGYMRVSTDKQDFALQRDALVKAGCQKIYSDTMSGTRFSRPSFDRMLADISKGDTVCVWKIDRLGRSALHVISTADLLKQKGVALISITEHFDTSTPMGDFAFNLLACLAQFERSLLVERTKAGVEAARGKGKTLGRPRALYPEATDVGILRSQGKTIRDVALTLGISRSKVERILLQMDDVSPPPPSKKRRLENFL